MSNEVAFISDQENPYHIRITQSDVDLLWKFSDGLPLTGVFTFCVEQEKDGTDVMTVTGVITVVGVPNVTDGEVTVSFPLAQTTLLVGRYRSSFRQTVSGKTVTIARGVFEVERTAR